MQPHRNPPAWHSPDHNAQRLVLMELALAPPDLSDHISELARALELSTDTVSSAVDALVEAGLATRSGDLATVTGAVPYVDALLPLRLPLA